MELKAEGDRYPGDPRKLNEFKDIYLLNNHVHADDRGVLYETLHDYDLIEYGNAKFGQVYVVHNPVRNTVRAFHRHEKLWDYFTIVHGSAKFILVNPGGTTAREIILTDRRPQTLVVPPGCWHGWMSLEDDTVLLSVGSEVYNRNQPDEERVPPNTFDDLFEDGSPWGIKAR